jgi:ubiquinone/menaquinone biosynthesis C-methylase UbiE/DNA-binding transcriptional ArsR family regulator
MNSPLDEILASLKAAAEITRLRILHVLSLGELNVSELMAILGQSQPRVSRHLKILVEAGLITRHKEANWVLFRLQQNGRNGTKTSELAKTLVGLLPASAEILLSDSRSFEAIRRQRAALALTYFSENATDWERLRTYHIDEKHVEQAMLSLAGNQQVECLADLGTGTGRMLELFQNHAATMIGLDQSREMLAIARAMLEQKSLKQAQVRLGDIYALPLDDHTADIAVIHQVLHFLAEPQQAISEAARILKPKGRVLIADFAPHEVEELRQHHAHRRLGIASADMKSWLATAGLALSRTETLAPPPSKSGTGLTVTLWLAEKQGLHQ